MTTKEERIEKALDTLAELCDVIEKRDDEETDAFYNRREEHYNRRGAAEEILRHYRETEMVKNIVITVNGAVPVRPMTRAEATS